MFTSQELQQMKSLLSDNVRELEAKRLQHKSHIDSWVAYKKPYVERGNKHVVDECNLCIRNLYSDMSKVEKKIAKLANLQRRIKEEMVDLTIINRYEQEEGWKASSNYEDEFVEVLPEHDGTAFEAIHSAASDLRLMSSNEGWQDNKMESFATTGFAQVMPQQRIDLPGLPAGVEAVQLPYIITNTSNPEPVVVDPTSKPSNPKDAIGSGKLPIHLWPNTATAMGCIGFLNGMLKYGRQNFRAIGIRASIYYDAAKRHLDAWFEGEEVDPDDNVPHLAAALACIAIIVDAEAAGKLNDDRAYPGGYRALVDHLTPLVAQLKQHHESKTPHHYTIKDVIVG
jgi:hypothetical protein